MPHWGSMKLFELFWGWFLSRGFWRPGLRNSMNICIYCIYIYTVYTVYIYIHTVYIYINMYIYCIYIYCIYICIYVYTVYIYILYIYINMHILTGKVIHGFGTWQFGEKNLPKLVVTKVGEWCKSYNVVKQRHNPPYGLMF